MNIAAMTEAEFHNALQAIGGNTEFSTEISIMRPHSISKKRAEVDKTLETLGDEIGKGILNAGGNALTVKALAKRYFVNFIGSLLNELYLPIHDVLCSDKFTKNNVETAIAGAQIAALTQLLVDYLNISTVAALGTATAIVLAVIRATQGTFCKLSKQEILPRIASLSA